jgi:hypothetical protein
VWGGASLYLSHENNISWIEPKSHGGEINIYPLRNRDYKKTVKANSIIEISHDKKSSIIKGPSVLICHAVTYRSLCFR